MSLISRLLGRNAAETLSGAIRIGGESYNAQWDHTRVLRTVYKNPTGYRCVEKNAHEFMRPDWAVFDKKAKGQKLDDHPFLNMLENPMPQVTGTVMQYHIRRDLDLNGGTFLLKMRGVDYYGDKGPVTGLKRLAPQRVSVLTGDDDELLGFIYTDRVGRRAPILPEEMIYINLPDGDREWDRCAPGVVAGLPAEIDTSAMRFNAELLANDAALPGYLVVEGLTVKQFGEWTAAWRSGESPGKTRVLSSQGSGGKGGASYVRVGQSNQELAYDQLRKMSREDMCRALGYPSVLLDPTESTFANMDIARRTWIVGEVFPLWVWTRDFFTTALRDELPKGLEIGFDLTMIDELTENLDAIVTRGVQLVDRKAMTINELRESLGLPPVAWGNDFPEPPAQLAPGNETDETDETDKPDDADVEDVAKAPLRLRHIKQLGESFPTHVSTDLTDLLDEREPAAEAALTAFFDDQKAAICARIRSKKGKAFHKAVDDWWDGERWKKDLTEVVFNELDTTVAPAGALALSDFVPGAAWDATSERIDTYLATRSTEVAGLINDTTAESLRGIIADIANEGGGDIDSMVGAISGYFADNAQMRAERFARTEIVGAANWSSLEAAYQSEVVDGKSWNAASTADQECLDLDDGTVIGLDENFKDGVLHPPTHPNCRCALTFRLIEPT